MSYTNTQIAQMYHAFNMGRQAVAGDPMPAPPWEHLPEGMRELSMDAVERIRQGVVTTAENHHEIWFTGMTIRGYVWGRDKDHEQKTHPALLHWDELPERYRMTARMFVHIVQGLLAE